MEAEVTELTAVPKGERDPQRRLTSRNGYRERRWDTRVRSQTTISVSCAMRRATGSRDRRRSRNDPSAPPQTPAGQDFNEAAVT